MLRRLIRWATTKSRPSNDDQFPVQQVSYMGKVADSLVAFPLGLYATFKEDLALMFSAQGNPENRAHIPLTAKSRPDLSDDELALFHPNFPNELIIKLMANGELLIRSSVKVYLTAPDAEFSGNVKINGTLEVVGASTLAAVTSNTKNIGDTHGHTQGNDSDGDTEAPISGVT